MSTILRHLAAVAPAALLLAGCSAAGDADAPAEKPVERALEADERPAGAMSAWGKKLEIDCPRRFDIPDRPQGAAVDDLRGLRLGVPGETAIRFAQCPDGKEIDSTYQETSDFTFNRNAGGLDIRTSASVAVGRFPERWRGPDTMNRDDASQFETLQSVWHFVMDGMPGRETLFGMWLDQTFAEGARPTLESQVAALKAKYGEPSTTDARGRMFWLHLPDGKPIPVFERQKLASCSYSADPTARALRWGPDCGLMIAAEIGRSQNPLQAASVHVAVFDPAKLWNYQENRFAAERDQLLSQQAGTEAGKTTGGEF